MLLILDIIIISAIVLFIFGIYRVPILFWTIYFVAVSSILQMINILAGNQNLFFQISLVILWLLTALSAMFSIPSIRYFFIVKPIFEKMKKQMAHISNIEKQALNAGTPGFEKSLFSGHPDWKMIRSVPSIELTQKEREFLDGPAEEMCNMINNWDIRYKDKKIPDQLWNFAKKNGFLGLRVPAQYNGLSFSFQAQSIILGKIASRSLDVSTIVEVPNSLGPDELIKKYGTAEQKNKYLSRFAEGEEIPAFAITSPTGGTDAAMMRDVGYVEYGEYDGKKIHGIRLIWDKRYITFAPNATLIVLAFHLFDNNNLLQRNNKDFGITLALIPSNHLGVKIGKHIVGGALFPNGPIWGENVFIPLEWVIGGISGVGQGWKMIMECLFVGRAISLPSMSVATIKAVLRYSTAYACVRRQFSKPIGTMEGVEEALARLIESAYLTESARAVTASAVDRGERPIAIASLMKYQTTEYARRAVNDAMDIHGGRAICDGPSNYLQLVYQMSPIGITVEGANIVTRSLITFAQGVLSAHPYFCKEIESCNLDKKQSASLFETALLKHISLLVSNTFRAFFHNITAGIFGNAPKDVPKRVAKWYRQLWRESCNFAFMSDIITILLGNYLKKKQKIGGRLADALSDLYFLSCALKRYEDDRFPVNDYVIVDFCMKNGLYRLQEAISGIIQNFPNKYLRFLVRIAIFPFGANRKKASDYLGHMVVNIVLTSNEVRDRITRYIYVSKDINDSTGILEIAFQKATFLEPILRKIEKAIRSGAIQRFHGTDWIADAEGQNIITSQEASDIRELEKMTERVIAVDHFDNDYTNYK